MQVVMIDKLIALHWNGCTVQHGETPEQYAARREEEELGVCVTHPAGVFVRIHGVYEFLGTEGGV